MSWIEKWLDSRRALALSIFRKLYRNHEKNDEKVPFFLFLINFFPKIFINFLGKKVKGELKIAILRSVSI